MDYLDQERLAKLGFTRPLADLDCLTAQAYLLIDREFDRLRAADAERKTRKGK